jgi:hypothetical protein
MNKITVDNSGNYPTIEGAGLLGEEANKRIAEYWVHSGSNSFPPIDQVILDILIEDYNQRHSREEERALAAKIDIVKQLLAWHGDTTESPCRNQLEYLLDNLTKKEEE